MNNVIYVSCAVQQDMIIELLEKSEPLHFQYQDKKGIRMTFKTDADDLDAAVAQAKQAIKGSEIGGSLFFQVSK